MGFLYQTVIFTTMIFQATCYPDGTNVDLSCPNLIPSHGVSSKTSAAPYTVTFNPTSFAPGQTIAVTLASSSTGFKGFMIQARRADTNQNQDYLGSFSKSTSTRQACSGKALVHSSKTVKSTLTFNWIAPATSVGNITFRVTYVQSYDVFWVNKVSSVLAEAIPTTTTTTTTTTTSTTTSPTTTTPTTTTSTTTRPTTTTPTASTLTTTTTQHAITTSVTTSTTSTTTTKPTTAPSATTSMTSSATTTPGTTPSTATSASTTISTASTSPSTEASSTATTSPATEASATTSTSSLTTSPARINNDTSSIPNIATESTQDSTTTQQPSIDQTTTPSGAVANDTACGVTKGCFTSCDAARCSFVVSWQLTGATVTYTLSAAWAADSGIYIALGFSGDSKMGDDSVMGCVYQNNMFAKYTGFNIGKSSTPFSDNETQLTSSKYVNGVLSCQLTRPLAGSGQRYNLSQPWTLLFVKGSASIDNDEASIFYHSSEVYISTAPVSAQFYEALSSDTPVGATLVKAHGCLMVAAWIFLASIGTVVARFYKPVLTGTLCSQKVWFQLHRLTMVLVLCATASGFIIIFVKEKEWSTIEGEASYLQGHPIMGVIVMILTLLNPLMALFRPHPGTPKRPIFNWAHLLVGMSAHILGVITIFFGVKLRSAQTPDYAVKILGAYVAWQLFVYLVLEITTRCDLSKKSKGEQYELHDVDALKLDKPKTNSKSALKNLFLAVHCFVVEAFAATIIAVIAVGADGVQKI